MLSKNDFAKLVRQTLNGYALGTELADEFKVSLGTVSRWANGQSCPLPLARDLIAIRLLAKQATGED